MRPRLGAIYNSGFPHGLNDGAIWAGRGATGFAEGGVAYSIGPLRAVVAPMVFWTQNADVPILDNGLDGPERWAHGMHPTTVDYPQRFGDGSYARADLGATRLTVDLFGVTLGASNAHEWWGPAQRYPFLLGNNAAGFPHVHVGTSRPLNLGIGTLHGRLLWGRLEQSEHFVPRLAVSRTRRFVTGLAVVAQPRGLEQLEFGIARFIHAPWPDEGLPGRYVWRSFEGILKTSLDSVPGHIGTDARSIDGENQVASVYARLALPGTGFELYTEYGREDHPWDMRYIIVSPDEQSALTLGMRKVWRHADDRMTVLRAESINFQQGSVDRVRGSALLYLHNAGSNQGHTQRGQLLGAGVGVGSAAGAFVALDRIDASGRWTVEWNRAVRQEKFVGVVRNPPEPATERASDVVHSLGVERLLFRGSLDLLAGVTGSYNFNRNFSEDRTNLNVRLSIAGLPF